MKTKHVWNTFYGLITLLLLFIAFSVAASAFNLPGGFKPFTVQSGSMSPSISTGSLVFVQPATNYAQGDVITFISDKDKNLTSPKITTTHRIVKIKQIGGTESYVTKGDANDAEDSVSVKKDLVIGKVIFHLPLFGYITGFAKTQMGFILLIIIPATLIIMSEILNIKNEAKRLMAEKRKRKLGLEESMEEKIGEEMVKIENVLKK